MGEEKRDIYAEDWRNLRIGCFDTETTGLQAKLERIVEFGLIIIEDGKAIERYNRLINPGEKKKMNPRASKVNGITDEMLVKKKPFSKRYKKIRKLLNSCDVWCCYNDGFDRGFLREEFRRLKEPFVEKPTIDPLIWSQFMWPSAKNNLESVMSRLRIDPSTKELKELGIKTGQHRADYDSFVTGHTLFRIEEALPRSLRQTLYVQDYLYRYWLRVMKGGSSRFARAVPPTLPPEHVNGRC